MTKISNIYTKIQSPAKTIHLASPCKNSYLMFPCTSSQIYNVNPERHMISINTSIGLSPPCWRHMDREFHACISGQLRSMDRSAFPFTITLGGGITPRNVPKSAKLFRLRSLDTSFHMVSDVFELEIYCHPQCWAVYLSAGKILARSRPGREAKPSSSSGRQRRVNYMERPQSVCMGSPTRRPRVPHYQPPTETYYWRWGWASGHMHLRVTSCWTCRSTLHNDLGFASHSIPTAAGDGISLTPGIS